MKKILNKSLLKLASVSLLGIVCQSSIPNPQAVPTTDEKVEALLAKMTLAEKIGQLNM
ncbi:MAG: hypothetical protein ACOVQA_06120 [Thermoflexibacteraceae bacterium]|jgi:hypothetical protein